MHFCCSLCCTRKSGNVKTSQIGHNSRGRDNNNNNTTTQCDRVRVACPPPEKRMGGTQLLLEVDEEDLMYLPKRGSVSIGVGVASAQQHQRHLTQLRQQQQLVDDIVQHRQQEREREQSDEGGVFNNHRSWCGSELRQKVMLKGPKGPSSVHSADLQRTAARRPSLTQSSGQHQHSVQQQQRNRRLSRAGTDDIDCNNKLRSDSDSAFCEKEEDAVACAEEIHPPIHTSLFPMVGASLQSQSVSKPSLQGLLSIVSNGDNNNSNTEGATTTPQQGRRASLLQRSNAGRNSSSGRVLLHMNGHSGLRKLVSPQPLFLDSLKCTTPSPKGLTGTFEVHETYEFQPPPSSSYESLYFQADDMVISAVVPVPRGERLAGDSEVDEGIDPTVFGGNANATCRRSISPRPQRQNDDCGDAFAASYTDEGMTATPATTLPGRSDTFQKSAQMDGNDAEVRTIEAVAPVSLIVSFQGSHSLPLNFHHCDALLPTSHSDDVAGDNQIIFLHPNHYSGVASRPSPETRSASPQRLPK